MTRRLKGDVGVFIAHGEADKRVSVIEATRMWEALRAKTDGRGCVELVVGEREGHCESLSCYGRRFLTDFL